MDKLLIGIMAFFFMVTPVEPENLPEEPSMYIENAMLSLEERYASMLFNPEKRQEIFDFSLDDSTGFIEINTYQLADGDWNVISRENRYLTYKKGRIALGFQNIGEGVTVAIQNSGTGEASSYTTVPVFYYGDMGWGAGVHSGREEISYDEEIPLLLQVVTSGNPVDYYLVEYFFSPEVYEDYDYEQVFVITVRFRRETETEPELG